MTHQPSGFITEPMMARARRNAETDPWCAKAIRGLIEEAAPWHARSDVELWDLMFGPAIPRSWHVCLGGSCPACKGSTPAGWTLKPREMPWKVACPHCGEQFPKNDFQAYYRSGLDEHGVFDPQRADRGLLVNLEHPDPADPLHRFGVDDGEGYAEGERRWLFIAVYVLGGIWHQEVLPGIVALSTAYALTGDRSYARQAAILLDRVADLYPLFDFGTQGIIYPNSPRSKGAIDNWHAANVDMLQMALAYDRIRPALAGDAALVKFLSSQARRYRLENPKSSWADVQRNLEDRLFRDALYVHPERVPSNYPRGEILRAVLIEILNEPGADKVLAEMLDTMVDRTSQVDGVTGEKGLPSYCAYTIAAFAEYLALLSRRDPGLMPALLKRHPRLRQTYRFHAETMCLQRYQPNIGDAGGFAMPVATYGVFFGKEPSLTPSQFSFMMELYRATGDPVYVQMLNIANQENLVPAWPHDEALQRETTAGAGLPYDLFAEDPAAFRSEVQRELAKVGPELRMGSVNKQEWALGILRSGTGDRARALWLDYDIGGSHSHADGMNLGFYALGLDLMPDAGYPQLQFMGTEPAKSHWFVTTAAHNTVVVDGRNQGHYYQNPARGRTTLWADGKVLRGIRTAFGTWPDPLPPLCGPDNEHVALYAYRVGRFRAVRVWTRATDSAEWTLAFQDDFQRAELGPDWKVIEGEWRIESGTLVGKGKLVCTRRFPRAQRLDYEAQSGTDQPCDLSAYLSSSASGNGSFFGFGSNNNQESKLIVRENIPSTVRSDRRIIPGRVHRVSCRCEPQRLQMFVDDSLVLDCDHLTNLAPRLVFGDDAAPKQFERTAAMVDVSPADAYVVDVFRVVGGSDHSRFFHSSFGSLKAEGLSLRPADGFGEGIMLRNIQSDPQAPVGWNATWTIEDYYQLLPAGSEVHLRHYDLTRDAEACVAESWTNARNLNHMDEHWIPTLVTRHRGPAPLATTFVAVLEPYDRMPFIASVRRLELTTPGGAAAPDSVAAIEVTLKDGRRDLIIVADPNGPKPQAGVLTQAEWGVKTDGDLALVRRDAGGRTRHVTLARGSFVEAGTVRVTHQKGEEFSERDL